MYPELIDNNNSVKIISIWLDCLKSYNYVQKKKTLKKQQHLKSTLCLNFYAWNNFRWVDTVKTVKIILI